MRQRVLALVLAAVLPTGCVANKAYHGGNERHHEELMTKQFDPLQTQISNEPFPYRLSFVEFDDRGELFNRTQLATALSEIEEVKKDASAGQRPLVVVFIHGWKNNASDSSGNVWGFRQVLATLSLQFGKTPVLGIYIGWRGAVTGLPILKEFTFFDRRLKSQSLPNAQMVETLTKIMKASHEGPSDRQPVSVLVGHSFGGAVLETALTDSLMQSSINVASPGGVSWPADLVIFINEAQEAIRSYQLIETMHANLPPEPPCTRPNEKGSARRPVVVSMSSTGDYATRAFYPGAQALLRPFNTLRSYPADNPNFLGFKNQSAMFFNPTAHLKQFQSHLLGRADDPDVAQAALQCAPVIDYTVKNVRYLLVEKTGAVNRTPYWVMHIPSAVVPDHSTIFTPVFTILLSVFIHNAIIP